MPLSGPIWTVSGPHRIATRTRGPSPCVPSSLPQSIAVMLPDVKCPLAPHTRHSLSRNATPSGVRALRKLCAVLGYTWYSRAGQLPAVRIRLMTSWPDCEGVSTLRQQQFQQPIATAKREGSALSSRQHGQVCRSADRAACLSKCAPVPTAVPSQTARNRQEQGAKVRGTCAAAHAAPPSHSTPHSCYLGIAEAPDCVQLSRVVLQGNGDLVYLGGEGIGAKKQEDGGCGGSHVLTGSRSPEGLPCMLSFISPEGHDTACTSPEAVWTSLNSARKHVQFSCLSQTNIRPCEGPAVPLALRLLYGRQQEFIGYGHARCAWHLSGSTGKRVVPRSTASRVPACRKMVRRTTAPAHAARRRSSARRPAFVSHGTALIRQYTRSGRS